MKILYILRGSRHPPRGRDLVKLGRDLNRGCNRGAEDLKPLLNGGGGTPNEANKAPVEARAWEACEEC